MRYYEVDLNQRTSARDEKEPSIKTMATRGLYEAGRLLRNSIRFCKSIPFAVFFVLLLLRHAQKYHIANGKHWRRQQILNIRFTGGKNRFIAAKDPSVDVDAIKTKIMEQHVRCQNWIRNKYFQKLPSYGVFYNYFEGDNPVQSNSTVTLATYGYAEDIARYTEALAVQWQGPISMAVMIADDILKDVVYLILYLRECKHPSIAENVSFHFVFKENHYPQRPEFIEAKDETNFIINCNQSTYLNVSNSKSVNFSSSIAKNIAKLGSKTEFVLNSHISFYPSNEVSKQFLDTFSKMSLYMAEGAVFLLPLVVINGDVEPPTSVSQLEELMSLQKARFFIRNICGHWKTVLSGFKWNDFKFGTGNIHTVLKFYGLQLPYIERKCDPLYDEEDGYQESADAKLKMFNLCMMDYKIEILSGSFFLAQEKDEDDDDAVCGIDETTAFNIKTLNNLKILYGSWTKCDINTE